MPGFLDVDSSYEVVTLGEMNPLDLTGVHPEDGTTMTSQGAVLQMFDGWDMIKGNFDLIWSTMMTQEERAKSEQSRIRAQLQESIDYLNDIGAKARLLSAKLGCNPKSEADGDTLIWETLSSLCPCNIQSDSALQGESHHPRRLYKNLRKGGVHVGYFPDPPGGPKFHWCAIQKTPSNCQGN
jgi:hypothetical protein